jgi:CRISPR-associated protein Csm2
MNAPPRPNQRPNNTQTEIIRVPSISSTKEREKAMIDRITKLDHFSDYKIRELVQDAQFIGDELNSQNKPKDERLKTNQIRKFLDAINRIKFTLSDESSLDLSDKTRFDKLEIEIVLLKPKLAYAAAREKSVKPLQKVLDLAIDRVKSPKGIEDFERLVQFIESIVAYHKAAGGES